jgi:hypothetical protein
MWHKPNLAHMELAALTALKAEKEKAINRLKNKTALSDAAAIAVGMLQEDLAFIDQAMHSLADFEDCLQCG